MTWPFEESYYMTKKAVWLWLALVGTGINSCTSPLEQMPEKVVITADPTIRLPLGDPLKGNTSLGEELKKALDIDAKSMGLEQLYDYTDPGAPQDRKFLLYQELVKQEIDLKDYKTVLQVESDDLQGLPNTVNFKQYLPSVLPSLPAILPAIDITLNGTVTLANANIQEIQGDNSGLSLVCKGSKTIPNAIRVQSEALNLDQTKEQGDVVFGPLMTFMGDAFILEQQDGKITIDIEITMTFTKIVDTNDIGITPGFIFNWTQVKLDLSEDIGEDDLTGSYPDTEEKPITLKDLKESLFQGKLQFQEIPLYMYVSGPEQWFENENIVMNLKVFYTVEAGEASTEPLHDGPIGAVSLPVINPSGQSYGPKTSISHLPSSISGNLASVFNQYPVELGFTYEMRIQRYIITPAMLNADTLTFEAAIALILPLAFTVKEAINLAQDMQDFSMPDFGDKDLLGRKDADESSQAFDFIKGIRLAIEVDNRLGLDGAITLYANKILQETGGAPLGTLGLQGASSLELTQEDLRGTWPFSPAFDIRIPADTELKIKRTIDDNPFGLTLTIWVEGAINQEISL
jgi:hypothetical protein